MWVSIQGGSYVQVRSHLSMAYIDQSSDLRMTFQLLLKLRPQTYWYWCASLCTWQWC